jgi:hypothetical protein
MADLNRFISDNLFVVVAALAVVVLILLTLVAVQSVRLGRALRSYRALAGDGSPGSIADLLAGQTARAEAVRSRLEELEALHTTLERRSRGSLQHIGLVRFNPFEDTGSDQSFAIALLDDQHDGIVLSSLHGRTNTRLFAKPVENGASRHSLSEEESRAISIAIAGTGQAAGPG